MKGSHGGESLVSEADHTDPIVRKQRAVSARAQLAFSWTPEQYTLSRGGHPLISLI